MDCNSKDEALAKQFKKMYLCVESRIIDYDKEKIRYALIEASDKLFKEPVEQEKD